MNKILDKILLYEAMAEFSQIFCLFFGQWSFKKKYFWDSLTFSRNFLGTVKNILFWGCSLRLAVLALIKFAIPSKNISYVYLELQVEKYYSVVGILEKWKESLEVMEHYVPRFFTNVTTAYKLYMKDKPKNKNNIKPKVSKKIKDLVAANFTVEIDFYEFCKQRFYKQYLAMK